MVVGGGAAGLYVALRAAEDGAAVTLVSRKPLSESASFWAQGGLAAALADDDSPARHAQDTLNAGRGLCRSEAVEVLTSEAPAAVAELRERGVRFDLDPDGGLSLALEGGHSARRIVHAGGAQTGRAITGRLAELVGADDRIRVLEQTSVLALWSDGSACAGVVTDAGAIAAPATVLATGGGAALWRRTRTPGGRSAPARCWPMPRAPRLRTWSSASSTQPRSRCPAPSTTARSSPRRSAVRGRSCSMGQASDSPTSLPLVIRSRPRSSIAWRPTPPITSSSTCGSIPEERFPSVFAACRAAGLDPGAEPVPVAPAAHYLMGGVVCDLDGTHNASGPLRRGRMRLQRRPRSEPARLELAQRMLRVRRPSRRRGRSRQPGR